jgi:1,4-alpha-glucan branching enzyme
MDKGAYSEKELSKVLRHSADTVGGWPCTYCTFVNDNQRKLCRICENERKKQVMHPVSLSEKEKEEKEILGGDITFCPKCGTKRVEMTKNCRCGFDFELFDSLGILPETPNSAKSDLPLPTFFNAESLGVTLLDEKSAFLQYWNPEAAKVWIMGEFNHWGNVRDPKKFQMVKSGDIFSYSLENESTLIGSKFKYFIQRTDGKTEWRNDPRSVCLEGSNYLNDVFYDQNRFQWTDEKWKPPPLNELVIYEAHVSTLSPPSPHNGTYISAIQRLDYLSSLGINCLELMPIHQDFHPSCWGYDPISLFAVDRSYGTPDELKKLINECHKRNIAVILDWVPNHMSGRNILSPCYFPPHGNDKGRTEYGPRPDYENPRVRSYILDSLFMWLHYFHFDGVRIDSIETMRNYSTKSGKIVWLESWTLIQEMTSLVRSLFPEKIMIAEDLQNESQINQVCGFDAQWDAIYFSVLYNAAKSHHDSHRNAIEIAKCIQANYFHSSGFGRVIYTENHDTIPDSRQWRIPKAVMGDVKATHPNFFAKRRTTLVCGILMCTAGIPMLLQGQEYMEMSGPNWPKPPHITDYQVENFSEERKTIFRFFQDLIQLRLNKANATKGLIGSNTSVFHIQADKSLPVLAFHRWDKGGPGDDVVVLANFSNLPFPSGYRIGLPRGGTWKIRLAIDDPKYQMTDNNMKVPFVPHIEADRIAHTGHKVDGFFFSSNIPIGRYSMLVVSQDGMKEINR